MTISRRESISLSRSTLAGVSLAALTPQAAQAAKSAAAPGQGKKWWMDEPIRMVLVLYSDKEPPLDTDKFVQQLVDINANAVILPSAGIAAYYPTKVPFHFQSPALPAGRDIVGEVVKKAHARGIYVVSRFEWTVNQSPGLVEAHPDWVQRDANGQVKPWNDTYLMCVNGGYMQDQIFKIMGEVLAKYPIDGMFFNQGGQRMAYGPCHCDNCKRLYRAKANRDNPAQPDAAYLAIIADCAASLNDKIEQFVRGKRPDINFMVGRNADSRNAETHSAPVSSSHAFWVYQASETVNRQRSTDPEKMAFNNDAVFIDGYWRYAHRSAPDGEIRAYQNMANGAGPYLFMNGTWDQHDGNGVKGARPAFQFHKDHEELYVRQENAARVLLLEERGAGFGPDPPARPAAVPPAAMAALAIRTAMARSAAAAATTPRCAASSAFSPSSISPSLCRATWAGSTRSPANTTWSFRPRARRRHWTNTCVRAAGSWWRAPSNPNWNCRRR